MADYINRQAFRQELIDTPFYCRCKITPDLLTSVQDRLNDTLELLDNFPPADVRPVIYSRWVWDGDAIDWGIGAWRCERCQKRAGTLWEMNRGINPLEFSGYYCGFCGADMRGKADG